MSAETATPAPAKKRNYFVIIASMFFLIGLPVLTVTFSKMGLDKFKSIKSDMRLLKDSLQLQQFDAVSAQGDTFNAESLRSRLILIHLFDCQKENPDFATFQRVQKQFGGKEERGNVFFLSMPIGEGSCDTAAILSKNNLGEYWFLLPANPLVIQNLKISNTNEQILMIDPRGYLCDSYAINNDEEYDRMRAAISLLMPKQKRKKYQFRAETNMYKE
jgi:hypothetical protein